MDCNRLKGLVVLIGMFSATSASAVTIPNVFSAGDPAVAAEVNENFAVLESAINAAAATSFDDYYLEPSSTGALGTRNVIVWKIDDGPCYIARGWFTNTTNISVTVLSGSTTPDEIFVWQKLCGDNTSVTEEGEYVFALPSSGGFEQAEGVSIRWDEDGDQAFDSEGAFDFQFTSTSTPLANMELNSSSDLYFDGDGELLVATNWARLFRKFGQSLTVNGMTFDDVAVASFLGFERTRFHVKGIGPVLELSGGANADPVLGGQERRAVIFYRIEGEGTAGSLAGTPFGGSDVASPWFIE